MAPRFVVVRCVRLHKIVQGESVRKFVVGDQRQGVVGTQRWIIVGSSRTRADVSSARALFCSRDATLKKNVRNRYGVYPWWPGFDRPSNGLSAVPAVLAVSQSCRRRHSAQLARHLPQFSHQSHSLLFGAFGPRPRLSHNSMDPLDFLFLLLMLLMLLILSLLHRRNCHVFQLFLLKIGCCSAGCSGSCSGIGTSLSVILSHFFSELVSLMSSSSSKSNLTISDGRARDLGGIGSVPSSGIWHSMEVLRSDLVEVGEKVVTT